MSFCVYGSVGRGTMNPSSDIDFLIVAEPLPDGRVQRVGEFLTIERGLKDAVLEASGKGVFVEFSPILKTPAEVKQGSLLFLDMIEDGRILFDKGDFLQGYFASFREKLRSLGARRVYRGDARYWILKEPFHPGEVIEL